MLVDGQDVKPDRHNSSSMASFEDTDPAVMEAAIALGVLASQSSAYNSPVNSPSPGASVASSSAVTLDHPRNGDPAFLSRVSKVPMVHRALQAYQTGKQSSKVVNFGGYLVESGIQTISKPVISRLEPQLEQLDDFACRQLDRIAPLGNIHSSSPYNAWQSVLYTMSTTAGGVSAYFREDSMKSLRFCLSSMDWAIGQIERHIVHLKEIHASMVTTDDKTVQDKLSAIRTNLVGIIKHALDTVSKYAGRALPEPAREVVKAIILHLPSRFAISNEQQQQQSVQQRGQVSHGAGDQVLLLATEGLQSIQHVACIFRDSIQLAENWLGSRTQAEYDSDQQTAGANTGPSTRAGSPVSFGSGSAGGVVDVEVGSIQINDRPKTRVRRRMAKMTPQN